MAKIRKGDIVGRLSYGKDILFIVERIVRTNSGKDFAILKGLTLRIEADSPLTDLEIIEPSIVENTIRSLDNRMEKCIERCICNKDKCYCVMKKEHPGSTRNNKEMIYTGKILHLDGDKKYSEKSAKYYKSFGLDAVVKNIAENKQPQVILTLLNKYHPDILIITGHDGMIKNGTGFHDLYNYRNSKYFINTVRLARGWAIENNKDLSIFAGACQSYFEAIMSAGANFASSPARVLIDFADPLIIAEKIATTDSNHYLTILEVADELRDGTKGVGGTGSMGKKHLIIV